MTGSQDISVSDLSSGTTIQNLVHTRWPSTLCLFPGIDSKPEEYLQATLIITDENSEQIKSLISDNLLPEYTPILFLGSNNRIPSSITNQGKNRLVDYLAVPVTREVFLYRVSFLNRVQKISSEHHANTTALSKQLNLLYSRDGLTGLFNRRQLTKHLAKILQPAQEEGQELSLLMLNIDYLNDINKSSGLEFGDLILNEMAARLTEATRDIDTCYRFSGEDFVVMLPEADIAYGLATAKSISKACCEKPFTDGVHTTLITLSIGVASLQDHKPDNHDNFIFMAENALFMAKADGRNRIRYYIPQNAKDPVHSQTPLKFLKEKLNRTLEKTRVSAISSLQLLAKNVAGPEHKAHIVSVSYYAGLLGQQLGLPEKHIQTFQNSITLYNSFRVLLHNDLITKPAKLTRAEQKTMKDLPFKLTELTDMFDYFAEERNVLHSLGERYDGSGYPLGLKGAEIPLGSRIFNIVDALAAMNSERPYRKRLSPEEIIVELTKEAGRQFDPFLVLQLLTLIKKNNLFDLDSSILEKTQKTLLKKFSEFTS